MLSVLFAGSAVELASEKVVESKAIDNGYLVNRDDYTGSLVYDELDYNHGYYAVCNETQGDNNWFSVFGNAMKNYTKMWITDDGNKTNHFQGTNVNNNIWWKQNFGPEGGDDAIALWRAPFNGTVHFGGRWYKNDFSSGSDGVTLSIVNKKSRSTPSTLVVSQTLTSNFQYISDISVNVISGEMYMFSVNQYNSSYCDTTCVQIRADFTKNEENPGSPTSGTDVEPLNTTGFLIDEASYVGSLNPSELDYNHGFISAPNSDQGDNNWFAAYGSALASYKKMTARDGMGVGNHWHGNDYNNGLWWKENLGADAGDEAIAIYRAPYNGKVKFEGRIRHYSDLGGGNSIVSVVNKKTTDSVPTLINSRIGKGDFMFIIDMEISVISGEMYMFSVGQYSNTVLACSAANIKATFTKDEQNPGDPATGTAIEPTGYAEAKIFTDKNMHLTDYTEELGYCKDSEHAYYSKAKIAYLAMSSTGKSSFNTHADYAGARARLEAWARANGESLDTANSSFSSSVITKTFVEDETWIILAVSILAILGCSSFFIYHRRKEN